MSTAIDTLRPVIDRLDAMADAATGVQRDYLEHVIDAITTAFMAPATGTMRAWMQAHDGMTVATVQVTNKSGQTWAPTGRTIDARRASYVELSGSRRDYSGMRVQHVTEDCLIVSDSWHTIAYVIERDLT